MPRIKGISTPREDSLGAEELTGESPEDACSAPFARQPHEDVWRKPAPGLVSRFEHCATLVAEIHIASPRQPVPDAERRRPAGANRRALTLQAPIDQAARAILPIRLERDTPRVSPIELNSSFMSRMSTI